MSVKAAEVRIGGLFGLLAIGSYLTAIFAPLDWELSFAVGMTFPICAIVYAYGLYRFIAAEKDSMANTLGLIFSIGGFVLLAAMMAVQLAVRAGMEEYQTTLAGFTEEMWPALRRVLRLADLGLDVAWDFFIGSGLVAVGAAMFGHSRFRWPWAAPMVLFGLAVIVLNAMTFPWPPDTRDLFDVGPFVGVFMLMVSVRLLLESRRMPL